MAELKTEKEESFGCIPVRQQGGVWEVLLVEHARGGHLKPPKGHRELNEKPEEAALRELHEETGIETCKLVPGAVFNERYTYPHAGQIFEKEVTYYLCHPEGAENPAPRESDVTRCMWLPLSEAIETATFLETKDLLANVQNYLESRR
jgi:8-oxo-dGTP pyrophosphatase MutT (NUDIX family)